ncbi:MAG: manganese efflux pump MntP family protein [Fibromonadales bacterium]|nr:manganese efflux pump MntP family protein [Fibromonadales bacterium]
MVVEIILLAVALSMDAFAVSITLGLSVEKPRIKELLIPGIYFGLFQALMPLTGYFAGTLFASKIQHLDHWIAFALLSFIGAKMIKESFEKNEENAKKNRFQFASMLLLSIATSIDALAVGVTFAFFEINILVAIAVIGFTTFCLSVTGVKIGNLFGTRFKSKAEFLGGVILILIGLKMLMY